jgi:UDP-N-acetylmuramyl pentapeptide phosphotransferase/UDP-N-acetylglucosamine-1-phosphate transferase
MDDRQIDFPELQKEVPWITPAMLGISILCVVIVVIILLTDFDGAFIGPWG